MNTAGSVLVDTTVVVAYFRGESALRSRFIQAAVHLPWVVLGEPYYGAQRAQCAQRSLIGEDDSRVPQKFLDEAKLLLLPISFSEGRGINASRPS